MGVKYDIAAEYFINEAEKAGKMEQEAIEVKDEVGANIYYGYKIAMFAAKKYIKELELYDRKFREEAVD